LTEKKKASYGVEQTLQKLSSLPE